MKIYIYKFIVKFRNQFSFCFVLNLLGRCNFDKRSAGVLATDQLNENSVVCKSSDAQPCQYQRCQTAQDRALAGLREHWSVMGLAFAICTSRDFQREGSSVFPRHGFNVG